MSKEKSRYRTEAEESVARVMVELSEKVIELTTRERMEVVTMAMGLVSMRMLAATTMTSGFPVEESYEKFVDVGLRAAFDDAIEELQEWLVDAAMASVKI